MNLDFSKGGGLLPVIVQDAQTMQVLMLGYMNEAALQATRETGFVVFYSRRKARLWMKGETSGNRLKFMEAVPDCDRDTLLIKALPVGPVCHTGNTTCFGEVNAQGFLYKLEAKIANRIADDSPNSYTNELYRKGVAKIAQKVAEEAVELVIEAMRDKDDLFRNEAADLLYHLLILLRYKGLSLEDIEQVLKGRELTQPGD